MSNIDPIKSMTDAKNKNTENEYKFYLGMRDYYIHVEDKGNAGFYEEIIKKIYPSWNTTKTFKVFANYNGKNRVVGKFFEDSITFTSSLNGKHYFIIDKDFNDKFPNRKIKHLGHLPTSYNELKEIKEFRILKKYCIENYFLDENLIKNVSKNCSSCIDKDLEIYSEYYKTILKHVKILSQFYMFNQFFQLSESKAPDRYLDCNLLRLRSEEIEKLEVRLEKEYNNNKAILKEEITCMVCEEYSKMKDKIFGAFTEKDIDGKVALDLILKMNKFKLKDFSNHLTRECFSRHMIAYVQNNADYIFEELRNDLNLT